MKATSSFTGCCYCGNGIQYGNQHKFCTACKLRFCVNCQSSHPSAHSYNTYTMTAVNTTTDDFRPSVCSGCAKLAHSNISCQRNDCSYVMCTDCFDNTIEENNMHDHDELVMTSLPHRESLDKFEVGCKACREGKAFAHCTRCLEGIQPSSYFYSCMDCLRIYDDVTSTANLCETCMVAVRVTPQSLNHRFASFMFVISGEDESWSVNCSHCHMTMPTLDSNVVSRHAHNSWTITMGRKFAETYPSLAVRTCARTSPGSTNSSQYQYSYPSPSPSPAIQDVPPVSTATAIATPDLLKSATSPGPHSGVTSPNPGLTRQQSVVSATHHSPSAAQTQAAFSSQTASAGPDMSSNPISQNFARMSLSYSQTPTSPVSQQQAGAVPAMQAQTQVATPTTTQSPQQMYPPQQPAASAYPQNATTSPSHPRQGSMSYPGTSQSMYQPTPAAAQIPVQQQQQQQQPLQNQPQPATTYVQQGAHTLLQQQQQQQQQQQFNVRPMAMHAHTALAGSVQQMQAAPQQRQVMYTNAAGQVMQAQPTQYMMTQQVINGQVVNVPVATQNGPMMQQPMAQNTIMMQQPQPNMLHHANTFPASQMMQAPQQMAMVQVRTANGATVLVPQSQIQIVGGQAQVKPGVLSNTGIAGGSATGAARANAAAVAAANAEAKSKAQTNKFMQDLAKVAVGSLVKGVVSGAMH